MKNWLIICGCSAGIFGMGFVAGQVQNHNRVVKQFNASKALWANIATDVIIKFKESGADKNEVLHYINEEIDFLSIISASKK